MGPEYILLTCRVHPGETSSSWVLDGTLNFLLNDDPKAEYLRKKYIFKVIPMLNPDGVVVGNHRCSLVGYDLNRQYKGGLKKIQETFMPEIFWTKSILYYMKAKGISPKLIIDYHAHSRKQNSFFLACRAKKQGGKAAKANDKGGGVPDESPEEGITSGLHSVTSSKTSGLMSQSSTINVDGCSQECQVKDDEGGAAREAASDHHMLHGEKELTKIFHRISSGFSMDDCSFKVSKKHSKKSGTLRHVGFFDLDVPMTYTLETTYNGCDKPGSNWNGYQIGPAELGQIGE